MKENYQREIEQSAYFIKHLTKCGMVNMGLAYLINECVT